MAHLRLGQTNVARDCFDRAARWLAECEEPCAGRIEALARPAGELLVDIVASLR
jgi:hypothetical protein